MGPWAKYSGGRSHSRPQRSYIRNIRRNKYSATHPPKQVHSLRDIRPNQCTGRVQDETQDRAATHTPNPRFSMTYMRTKQIRRHTPAEAGVWQYQAFSLCETQPEQCTDNTHREIWERAATQDPNTLDYLQNTRRRLKYGATHPLRRVCGNIMYLHCAIPDPTNAQIRPRAKHGSAQPPRPPTLDYPHLTKQIRHHTPASAAPLSLRETPSDEWPEKAYSEIRSAQPIRPQPPSLKNYNPMTNQICHTPASAGTFPL
ncbi:hypothetical protein BS47DRAFT_1366552 [Hydnum rufescens UP504]|uniref:Uncharacterized protein n=1 Tax=Hydnum rufescens UP504 TaxID=1448309 RepID=A0A9P6AKK9_9AGAM|nr:hypothetical protein BS47DRAFT_1366552 [Hydnum rufescens UP504]